MVKHIAEEISLSGNIIANNNKITSLGNGVNSGDAINKGQLDSITESHYQNSDAESSITGTTAYQQKVKLTFTPPTTGNYEISFSALITCSVKAINMKARIQVNDTTTKKEIVEQMSLDDYSAGAWKSYSGNFVVELTGVSNDIDLDFATGDAAKTMYIKESVITARRIS